VTPEVLAALRLIVAELGADAGVLLRVTPSGACVVTSSTLGPALGVDDVWSSAGSLSQADFRPELIADPDRIAALVPAGVLRSLALEPTAALVAPVGEHPLRIVLLWMGALPPVDVSSAMESEAVQRFTALAPLLDAQVRAHESASRLRTVVSALDQAVVVTVAGDVVANINAAAGHLLGLPPGHVDGSTLATAMRALRGRAVDPDALGVEVARLRESPTAVAHDWVWYLHGAPSHLRVTSAPVDTTTEQGRVWVFDDISAEMELVESEQRTAEALAESQERYRLLAENVSDVVIMGTAEGKISWVSPSVTATLGWVAEDLYGHRVSDFVRPDFVDLVVGLQAQVMRGEPAEFEAPFRTAAGGHRWMQLRSKSLLDDRGRVVGRVAGLWDVHAAHEAKEELERSERRSALALAESEHRYRLLAENVSDVVMLGTPDGTISWVSPSVTAALGWAPEDLVGHRAIDFVRPEVMDRLHAMQEQVMRGELSGFEAPMRTAAGDDRWMQVRAKPVLDDHGDVIGRVIGLWDVQASHDAREELERQEERANRALAESEERYRLLAEHVSDIVLLFDVDGVVTWVSPSVADVLGWTPDELVGRTTQHIAHPDHWDGVAAKRGRLLDGERVEYEVPVLTAGGDYRWMNIRATLFRDEHGRPAGLIAGWWDNQAAHDAREEFERKERRAALALAESERRYRMLAENVSDVVVQGTTHGGLVWVSPSVTQTLGWAPEDLAGSSFFDLVHPADLAGVMAAQPDLNAGKAVAFEARLRTAAGGHRWMNVRVKPVFGPDGTIVERVANWWDTQARHEATEQLDRSERRYELLLENSSEVVFQTVDGVVTWVSPAVEEVTGWTPADIIGTNSKQIWHHDDWERASWAHDGARDGTDGREVVRLRTPGGVYLWMEIVIRPYVEEDGRPGTVGMVYDVSDREIAQEAARRSEERYRMVAENASDIVCRYRADGIIEWVFGSTEAFLGRTAQEMVGTPLTDYFVVEDWGDREEIRARLGRGDAVQLLARLRHAEQGTRWVEVRAQAALAPDGSLESIIGTMRDAQAEVDYREALAESERQARDLADAYGAARDEAIRASTAKTAFLSRMSHELRTPLNAVLGFAQLLSLDPLTSEQAEAVHHIRTGGRHLLDLINEIVDISRIEAGRLSLTMQTVDSAAMLAEAAQLVAGLARQYDVTVVAEGAEVPLPAVHADQQRVTQVLLNLTSNAVKYNRPGGSVRVRCCPGAPGEVRFEVSDTGPGIPDHLLPRLFEPFDRLGAENTDVEGTGIGLALADALARAMGGRIEVSTKLLVGSTFTLVLRSAQTLPARAEPVSDSPDARHDSRLRILYIEDNPTNATLMHRVVSLRPGCRLGVATNGADGLAAMLPDPPDLVFLDVHLPDLRGDEVLQRLRRLPGCADVPVVVVTADASPSVRERMSTLGSDGFLTKPLDLTDVLGWIDAAAAGRAAR